MKHSKKLASKESWNSLETKIGTKEPCSNLILYRYNEFKEMGELLLTFKTYYSESAKWLIIMELFPQPVGDIHLANRSYPYIGKYHNLRWRLLGRNESLGMCENEGRGKLFKAYKDVGKHMAYRCNKDEATTYVNNSIECEVDRRTRYGDGVPKEDLFTRNGEIMYGKIGKDGNA